MFHTSPEGQFGEDKFVWTKKKFILQIVSEYERKVFDSEVKTAYYVSIKFFKEN